MSSPLASELRVSCFQPIQLYHDYRPRTILAVSKTLNPCASAVTAIVAGLHSLSISVQMRKSGQFRTDIIDAAMTQCPAFSETQLSQAFSITLKRGIIRILTQPIINFLQPLPTPRYTFSGEIDRNTRNAIYVRLLIQLIGGYEAKDFSQWFRAYCHPAFPSFALHGCTINPF